MSSEAKGEAKVDDRLFVRDGWRHYRRTYSLTEVRWGVATFAVLVLITVWVVWKRSHPADPALFNDGASLLKAIPAPSAAVAPTAAPAAAAPSVALPAVDRGPLPADLAGAGWREEKVAVFDPENLYVKIDGRADFFKSFGFKSLHSVVLTSEKDPASTIDVEIYDLGRAANALGAYGGERAPTAVSTVSDSGLHHIDRNALYLARGPYYIRVIGSDESPAIIAQLGALAATVDRGIKGEPLPWAYQLFVGGMGLDVGRVAYFAENAFSFGFARDVWTVRPAGKNDDLELFVVVRKDAAAARKMADQFRKGFLELGEADGKVGAVSLAKDRFLGTLAAVDTKGRFVLGVRGAADRDVVVKQLALVSEAVSKAPAPATVADTQQSAEKGGSGEHY